MDSGRGVLVLVLALVWNVGGAGGTLSGQTAPAAKGAPQAQPTAPVAGAAAAPPAASCGADLVKSLAGTWRAPQYKMKRGSEVGAQVFGPNSFDVRDVELSLDASGNGVLKITASVLDEKGKTWAPTLVEAKISVGAPPSPAASCEPAVTVAAAEERYLDELQYQAPLNGARVMMLATPSAKQLDLRFETPNGEGSFWTTLRRQASAR